MPIKTGEISREQAGQLVIQMQVAHQLLAGFYQRLLPLLEEMGSELDLVFRQWKSQETDPVPKGSTSSSGRWCWDFIPLYAFRQCYGRLSDGNARPGDIDVSFVIYFNDKFNGDSGCPDPISLSLGDAVFRAYAFKPIIKSKRKFLDLWNESEWPSTNATWQETIAGELNGIGWEWPLAEVICNPQVVLDTLLPICADTKSKAKPK